MVVSPESENKTVIKPNSLFKVNPSAVKYTSNMFGLSEISIKIILILSKHNGYMKITKVKGISWIDNFQNISGEKLIRNNKENELLDMQPSASLLTYH